MIRIIYPLSDVNKIQFPSKAHTENNSSSKNQIYDNEKI